MVKSGVMVRQLLSYGHYGLPIYTCKSNNCKHALRDTHQVRDQGAVNYIFRYRGCRVFTVKY